MKVLVLATRPPLSDGKGNAIRAATLLAALELGHDVELFVPAPGLGHRVLAAVGDLLSGRPAQVGFSMPRAEWAKAKRAAARADVVLAITVRAVRGPLTAPLVIDHVDALSLNWRLRGRGPEGPARRLMARIEAHRLLRWESRVAGWAAIQLVVSEHEVSMLPSSPPVVVVPHGITFEAPSEVERDIDVVFTGNMEYPPNVEAAVWLDREIAPALRTLDASARIVVAGRNASRLRLPNVTVMSDVPSVPALLARSRVAIVPLAGIGTGMPTKGLEAAACGAALVVTPWAHERLGLPARVAGDARGLAAAAAALLGDESARSTLARQARAALDSYRVEHIADRLEEALAAARR